MSENRPLTSSRSCSVKPICGTHEQGVRGALRIQARCEFRSTQNAGALRIQAVSREECCRELETRSSAYRHYSVAPLRQQCQIVRSARVWRRWARGTHAEVHGQRLLYSLERLDVGSARREELDRQTWRLRQRPSTISTAAWVSTSRPPRWIYTAGRDQGRQERLGQAAWRKQLQGAEGDGCMSTGAERLVLSGSSWYRVSARSSA